MHLGSTSPYAYEKLAEQGEVSVEHLREVDELLESLGGPARRLLRQPEVARQLRFQLSDAIWVAHPACFNQGCSYQHVGLTAAR